MKKRIDSNFAGSKYKRFQMSRDGILTIHISSWGDEIVRILFFDTIQFSYRLGKNIIKEIDEITGSSSFLEEALSARISQKK
jgi:hypothetical protein